MKRASRILISVLALLVLLSGTPALTAPVTAPTIILALSSTDSPSRGLDTSMTHSIAQDAHTQRPTIIGGSEEQRETADWAVAHFVDAGLELPQIVIAIHTSDEACDGYDGAFRSRETPARLDVCNPHRLIILHELAHAWDRHTLTDDLRQDFMDLRGLVTWNDPSTPWKERGVEDLAEVIVWGLRQFSGSAPFDEQSEKRASFALVTGVSLPNAPGDIASVPNIEADHDRRTDDTDWDTLH